MFTPAWPRAGPTGGAGVALPAGTCSFTILVIFFAMLLHLLFRYVECGFRAVTGPPTCETSQVQDSLTELFMEEVEITYL